MTFLEEMDKRLERTGHTLDTWSPGDAMGTRYRICPAGHDYDSAPRTACTALGRKNAELMVTAFVTGWSEGRAKNARLCAGNCGQELSPWQARFCTACSATLQTEDTAP